MRFINCGGYPSSICCLLILGVGIVNGGGCSRTGQEEARAKPPALSVTQGATTAATSKQYASTSNESGAAQNALLKQSNEPNPLLVEVKTTLGSFVIKLFPDKAPRTVENSLENYVKRGYYEQTIFHHVERDFMIVAGGYDMDLKPKPARAWIRNESNNGLSNRRGTVGMMRHPDYPHSATSQFFINVVDNPALDYQPSPAADQPEAPYGYTVFGEVVCGMEVVDRIATVPTRARGEFPAVPIEPVQILSVQRISGNDVP